MALNLFPVCVLVVTLVTFLVEARWIVRDAVVCPSVSAPRIPCTFSTTCVRVGTRGMVSTCLAHASSWSLFVELLRSTRRIAVAACP